MRAMLLCAGLGTRLGSLSDERPKPMLPVCDVPLVRYGLALLEAAGVREVCVNLFHRGDLIEQELAREAAGHAGVRVVFSREESLLGTGGGIRKALDWLTAGGRESFLVMNGKLVIEADLAALAAAHAASGAEGTMLLREVPESDERFGRVDLAADGRVATILGEAAPMLQSSNPPLGQTPTRTPTRTPTMFTGVHVVSAALAARLPEGVSCIVRQGYVPALKSGARIAGVLHHGYFQEHSTPWRYLEGNFALLRDEAQLSHPPAPLAGVDPAAEIAAGAVIEGHCRIGAGAVIGEGAHVGPEVVVGRDARVLPGARLTRTVVWPGAVASGELTNAIVTPKGSFSVEPDLLGAAV